MQVAPLLKSSFRRMSSEYISTQCQVIPSLQLESLRPHCYFKNLRILMKSL